MDWVLARLGELRTEFADGESQLAQLDRRRMQLHETMLRVAGAIQVLEELVVSSGVFDAFRSTLMSDTLQVRLTRCATGCPEVLLPTARADPSTPPSDRHYRAPVGASRDRSRGCG